MTHALLAQQIETELTRPAPDYAGAMARELAERGGAACAAVLYYGSALRAENPEGILDFYVLLDDVRAWPGSPVARCANRLLPPNVGYLEMPHQGTMLRAKYAVMSTAQFARRLQPSSMDTTIWARFCQPSLCVWSRSAADLSRTAQLVAGAVISAAVWAARLGPQRAAATQFWRALFAHTYAAELRVEKTARPVDIVDKHPERYAQLLPLAWQAAGLAASEQRGEWSVDMPVRERQRWQRVWHRRQRWGRPLNILRLLKAAFTFEGGMDYVAWKIERHRGVRIEVTDWQRRHPLLAAPGLYWRLRRQGILR